MPALLAFLAPVAAWLARNAFLSSVTAFLGPLITGIFKLGGGIFTAIAEIIVALSKSPEGRVMLAVILLALAFLYMRYHYIEQGRAAQRTVFVRKTCPPHSAPSKTFRNTSRRQSNVQ